MERSHVLKFKEFDLNGNLFQAIFCRNGLVSAQDFTDLEKLCIIGIEEVVSEGLKLISQAKSSEQLIRIFINLQCLRSVRIMSSLTQNKVVNLVMQYMHPGGPWYAPRDVRNQAMETVNFIFPESALTRLAINYAFKTLHPVRAFKSVLYHTSECLLMCCRSRRNRN